MNSYDGSRPSRPVDPQDQWSIAIVIVLFAAAGLSFSLGMFFLVMFSEFLIQSILPRATTELDKMAQFLILGIAVFSLLFALYRLFLWLLTHKGGSISAYDQNEKTLRTEKLIYLIWTYFVILLAWTISLIFQPFQEGMYSLHDAKFIFYVFIAVMYGPVLLGSVGAIVERRAPSIWAGIESRAQRPFFRWSKLGAWGTVIAIAVVAALTAVLLGHIGR